jgi:predicted histidine transporter YuiF (NhaC family)
MEVQRCRKECIMHVGFIDPYLVNPTMMKSTDLKKTEDYVLKCLLELQLKKYILLPYHWGYVFLLFLSNTSLEIRTN